MRLKGTNGFTLIELLVVVAIIGILASVVMASLNSVRAKARDTRRKTDLVQIRTALELYYSTYGTYVVAGSGNGGSGSGWFSYSGDSYYVLSVAQGLVNAGDIGGLIVDPSLQVGSNGVRTGYMIQANANNYTLYANLENPSTADTDTLNHCVLSGYDGFSSTYPVSAQINYCISN